MAIEVSRLDIASDIILELQSETRFLKLPIPPYLDLLGVQPLPSQVAIINAINTQSTVSFAQQFLVGKEKRTLRTS